MATVKLHQQREDIKNLVASSDLEEERKQKLLKLVPHMMPSELLRLKVILYRMMMIAASQETIDEIIEKKESPDDEAGLIETVMGKVLEKADKVEERVRRTAS